MNVWQKLQCLLPSYRRAQEREMQEELDSLAAIAGRGELGNLTRVAEEARSTWSWVMLEQLARDLRYAFRTMRHNRAFTAVAVLSLALGIGANTAIFSLVDALLLRWLPVRAPQELVQVKMRANRAARPDESFSYSIVKAFAGQKDIFSGVCGFSGAALNVGTPGYVVRVPGAWVTGGCYETLGLNPAAGRLLTPEDDQPGAPLVAVISYGYWERQFAHDPAVVGRPLAVNGFPVIIVGVSPSGFTGAAVGAVADITLPVAALPRVNAAMATLVNPGNFWLVILARPHGSVAQAGAHLNAVWPRMSEQVISPDWSAASRKEMAESSFELAPGGTGYSFLRRLFQKPLLVLMAVAGLVLLIACANVANLQLARASARQREISVRLAIGAGRARIVRQLLTESALLSFLGAALGIYLAWFSSRFLVNTLSSGPVPVVFDLTPNWHVLAFTSAVAMGTGILFGLAPAFQTTAAGGTGVLKDARMTRSRSRFLSSLVSVQVALSLILLVAAGLFVRTLQNLQTIDPGFRSEGALLVDLDGRHEGYKGAALSALYKDLLSRVRRIPGVVSASISSHTPLNGWTWSEGVVPKGQPLPKKDNALFVAAGPEFFATMQTPLIAGREFNTDDQGAFNVAIVNQTFANRFFKGRNPIGEYLTATVTRPAADLQIVGVVKDAVSTDLRAVPRPTVYVSYFQRAPGAGTIAVRAAGSLAQVSAAIRAQLQPSFPGTPLEVHALTEQVERTLVQERLMAKLASGFGILGLILACVGLYGLLAYSVVRRTREIGIRMALGARRSGMLWMVAGDALRLVILGIALGLPVAWAASRWVKGMLFGLTATDPKTITAAVLLLIAAGLAAAYFPSRRASRVDPMTALRHE